jgi:hypothetical protein
MISPKLDLHHCARGRAVGERLTPSLDKLEKRLVRRQKLVQKRPKRKDLLFCQSFARTAGGIFPQRFTHKAMREHPSRSSY